MVTEGYIDVTTYKRKFHNIKIDIITFIIYLDSENIIVIKFQFYSMVSGHGFLNLQFLRIYVINAIAELGIVQRYSIINIF